MPPLKRYALPFALLALLLAVVAGFPSFFIATIVEPVAVLIWAVWRIVASVNQNVYWLVLIVVCVILVMRIVPTEHRGDTPKAYRDTYRPPHRVDYWEALITHAILERHHAEELRDGLKKLVRSVRPQKVGSDPMTLEANVIKGKVPLSPETRRFLFPSLESSSESARPHRRNIIFWIPRALRRRMWKFMQPEIASIDEILRYLETEMEINHDK